MNELFKENQSLYSNIFALTSDCNEIVCACTRL